jgi:hypothetical protein
VADFTGLISCGKHDVFLLECGNPSSSPAAPSDAELALAAPSLSPAGGRPERRGPRLEGSPPRAREQASRGKRARHGGVGYGITHAHALAPQSPRPSGPNTPARARGLSRAPRGRQPGNPPPFPPSSVTMRALRVSGTLACAVELARVVSAVAPPARGTTGCRAGSSSVDSPSSKFQIAPSRTRDLHKPSRAAEFASPCRLPLSAAAPVFISVSP